MNDIDWISGTCTLSATTSDADELHESLHLSVRRLRPWCAPCRRWIRIPAAFRSKSTAQWRTRANRGRRTEMERYNVYLLKGPLKYYCVHISHSQIDYFAWNFGRWVNQVIIWLGLLRPWNQQTMANFGHAVTGKFSEALRRLARRKTTYILLQWWTENIVSLNQIRIRT